MQIDGKIDQVEKQKDKVIPLFHNLVKSLVINTPNLCRYSEQEVWKTKDLGKSISSEFLRTPKNRIQKIKTYTVKIILFFRHHKLLLDIKQF